MAVDSHLLLSDQPPELPRKAGIDGRFHYFRGISGQRYLFSTVAEDDLAGFRDVVVLSARELGGDRLMICSAALIDGSGLITANLTRDRGTVLLVHCLAGSPAERSTIVDDLVGRRMALAA